ncbi:DUF4189 domain-containing protein [Nocardia panacis]|uniref:DUF4189 domain-containing protein n=1 Tax=Nocardia panacis TaxID=2340916 RepID=A0A3A4JJ63_9NOCA|nr:DUF4189 domain-containing protein [Nocardia panacis]RJO68467.1 DUF4189 domain-containing protein [Nocardia panacis]
MSLLRNSVLGVAVASAAALGVLAAGTAEAAGTLFGTVTISPGTGKVGLSTDQRSWVAADAEAQRQCGEYDCQIQLRYSDGCAAVARGADGRFGWAAAGSRQEAEETAVAGLGESAPPFPDLGSASPRAAAVVAAACTENVR